jgi:hypothetical protein
MVDNSHINCRPPDLTLKDRVYVNNLHYLQEWNIIFEEKLLLFPHKCSVMCWAYLQRFEACLKARSQYYKFRLYNKVSSTVRKNKIGRCKLPMWQSTHQLSSSRTLKIGHPVEDMSENIKGKDLINIIEKLCCNTTTSNLLLTGELHEKWWWWMLSGKRKGKGVRLGAEIGCTR